LPIVDLICAAASTQPLDGFFRKEQNVKRSALYLAVAGGTLLRAVLIASIWFFPPHVYRLVMQDGVGGPGLGATGKGIGSSMKTWKSIEGAEVQ